MNAAGSLQGAMAGRARVLAPWLAAAVVGMAGCDRVQSPTQQAPSPAQASAQATTPAPAPAAPKTARWPYADAMQSAADGSAGLDPAAAMRRNYYVVFDASGSMTETRCSAPERKITVAKRALAEFAGKLPQEANFGLSVFDGGGIRELMPLGALDRAAVAARIEPIDAGGATPLNEAIRRAAAALTEQGRRQFGYGEFHLVVVTDGEASDGSPHAVVESLLVTSPIVLHTIGFCMGTNHSLNQPGKVVYRPADNPQELARGLADVLAESPSFAAASFK